MFPDIFKRKFGSWILLGFKGSEGGNGNFTNQHLYLHRPRFTYLLDVSRHSTNTYLSSEFAYTGQVKCIRRNSPHNVCLHTNININFCTNIKVLASIPGLFHSSLTAEDGRVCPSQMKTYDREIKTLVL